MNESKLQCTCACHVSNNPCCQKCNNTVVKQLVQMLGEDLQGLKIFCVDYGHRLVEIENLFSGKSFKPIHDAMELHVDLFDKRVKSVEHLVKHYQEGIEKCFERIETIDKTIHGLIDKIGEMANH